MELRVSIESEDAGADEICGITKIVTKLPFHLDGICAIIKSLLFFFITYLFYTNLFISLNKPQ